MSKEKVAPETEDQVMDPVEMAKKRKELEEFYESELPLMRLRAEYEKLATDIEEARFGRLQIRIAMAQSMQGPSEDDLANMPPEIRKQFEAMQEESEGRDSGSGKTKKKRHLKTEA